MCYKFKYVRNFHISLKIQNREKFKTKLETKQLDNHENSRQNLIGRENSRNIRQLGDGVKNRNS